MKYKISTSAAGILLLFSFFLVSIQESLAQIPTTFACAGETVCHTIATHRGQVQWQKSSDSTTWADIPGGVSDTLCMVADTSFFFRASITEGSCDTIFTEVRLLTLGTPFADAGRDTTICPGTSALIGGSPAASGGFPPYSYLWIPGISLSSPTDSNPVASPTGLTQYILTVTDSIGCTATDTVVVDTAGGLATGSDTLFFTGGVQYFIVPPCVDSITAEVFGAQGGSNSPSTNVNYGGRVQARFAVNTGDTLFVYVGEQPGSLPGGFNGGGNGETGGKGGGGASDIRMGGNTLIDRIVVAGGGGGGGFWGGQEVHGGVGGGLTGGLGYRGAPATLGGEGGTQTSSGTGTCGSLNNPITAGGFGFGGSPSNCGCEGYGGGGGWWGGAGSGNCRGGGGGSGYTTPAASNVTHTSGFQSGHGKVILSW